MGYLYVDGKAAYSDPATSGLVYMKADGTWSAPDSAYKYMDATATWSAPELKPASLDAASPNQLKTIAAEVAAGSSEYNKWLGTHTKSISFGSYGSTTFQLVAINHDDKSSSGSWTSSPSPSIWSLVFMADNQLGSTSLDDYGRSYGWIPMNEDNAALAYIRSVANSMDSSWSSVIVNTNATAVSVRDTNTGTFQMTSTPNAKLFLPSLMELGFNTTSYGPQEGKTFGWFDYNNTNSERIRRSSSGSAVRYMTRTGNRSDTSVTLGYTQMICISTSGSYESISVGTSVAIVPCFVIQG